MHPAVGQVIFLNCLVHIVAKVMSTRYVFLACGSFLSKAVALYDGSRLLDVLLLLLLLLLFLLEKSFTLLIELLLLVSCPGFVACGC